MRVTVHLHTVLQRQTAVGLQRRLEVELPIGATLGELYTLLEIPLPVDALLLVVNGRHAELDVVLQPADDVHFMPALSGG